MHSWRNQLLLGDSASIIQKMPQEIVALTATSPPYDDMRFYGGHQFDACPIIKGLWRITTVGGIAVVDCDGFICPKPRSNEPHVDLSLVLQCNFPEFSSFDGQVLQGALKGRRNN